MSDWKASRAALVDAAARGDVAAVRRDLAALLEAEASPRAFALGAKLAKTLAGNQVLVAHRLLVLRSYTAEPMVSPTIAQALCRGVALTAQVADYGQFEQVLLDPNVSVAADSVLLLARAEDLEPKLGARFSSLDRDAAEAHIETVVARARSWLTAVRERLGATPILAGLDLPPAPAYGLADDALELGHRRAIEELNNRFRDLCRSTSGAWFLPISTIVGAVGAANAYDARMWAHARQPYSAPAIGQIAERLARGLAARLTPRRKCVVLDCDNTLWGGVVGEDGLAGIALGPEYPGSSFVAFQEALLSLYDRGILLAIASKNNEADVLEVLADHRHQVLRLEHVAAHSIGWGDKASGIEAIASSLNIGLDSMVFIDDSDYECALVRERLPMVEVWQAPENPLELAPLVSCIESLDAVSISGADRNRGVMYKAQAARATAEKQAPSLESFLHSLELSIGITDVSAAAEIERAAQLCQRTNQLNVSTKRHSVADIEAMVADSDLAVRMVRLADRFGDYGICGLAIVRFDDQSADIDTFLLSCRVIGRGVEEALSADIESLAGQRATKLTATFVPTAKNAPAARLFDRLGFERLDANESCVSYQKPLTKGRVEFPAWFRVER